MKSHDLVMDLLSDWKSEQEHQAILMGSKWVNTDRLFTKDNGEPMFPTMPYKWLEKLCERNELLFYGIHSIRHVCELTVKRHDLSYKLSVVHFHRSSDPRAPNQD